MMIFLDTQGRYVVLCLLSLAFVAWVLIPA